MKFLQTDFKQPNGFDFFVQSLLCSTENLKFSTFYINLNEDLFAIKALPKNGVKG